MITYEEIQRIGSQLAQLKRETDVFQAESKIWEARMHARSQLKLKLKQERQHAKSRLSKL